MPGTNLNNLDAYNEIEALLGGAGAQPNDIVAVRAIAVLEGVSGGPTSILDDNMVLRLNAIDVGAGGPGTHENTLDALNSIVVLKGGTGGHFNDLDAINEWVDFASADFDLDDFDNIEVVYIPSDTVLTAFAGSGTVEARRDGDDAELTLFPDSAGLLRTAADGGGDTWQTWAAAGGGDGTAYAITWYDQSTNGNDATQATASLQAQLLDVNGQTVITGDDVDDLYGMGNVVLLGDFSIFIVGEFRATMNWIGGTSTVDYIQKAADIIIRNPTSNQTYTFPFIVNDVHVITAIRTSGTIVLRKDGVQTDSQAHAGTFTFNILGARAAGISPMDGGIMAVWIFGDAVTDDERDAVEAYLLTEFADQL